jgi:hypothetical protein
VISFCREVRIFRCERATLRVAPDTQELARYPRPRCTGSSWIVSLGVRPPAGPISLLAMAYAIGVFTEYRNKLASLRAQLDRSRSLPSRD